MKKTISFKTLGCRLNQFEIDALATEFKSAGYTIVGPETDADAYIINTCTVTNQSDVKSRNAVNKMLRKHPDAVHVVTGCFAENRIEELERSGTINYVVPNDQKRNIFTLLDSHFSGELTSPDALEKELFNYVPGTAGFHTRSMVKIQDGCDNYCTYCIIPFVRGRATSRPALDVIDHTQKLVHAGAKEIVLTGVNISRYKDGETDFTGLIERMLDIPGEFRLRITSMEPDAVDERFFKLFSHPKMCPHLHLCLQSGSDTVLHNMHRMYDSKGFLSIADTLKKQDPLFNITTDIMVGFPGETDRDFEDTLSLIEKVGFGHIHTFVYSVRSGTRAEKMENQIHGNIQKERSLKVRTIAELKKKQYRKMLIGKMQTMLIEQVKDGYARGYGEYYTPIKVPAADMNCCAIDMKNTFRHVRITGIDIQDDLTLIGEPV